MHMTHMTYGQRSWMTNHIAEGLRALNLPVTPKAIDDELNRMDVAVAASGTIRTAEDALPDSERLARELRGYGSICTTRPNPYQATEDAAELARPPVTADLDPAYRPKGQPADGYMLALAARQAVQDVKAGRATELPRAL